MVKELLLDITKYLVNMKRAFTTLFIILLIIWGCNQKPDYETLVEEGLRSGEEHNEMFLEYELGMPREEFYDVSWRLNKEKKITGQVKVEYSFDALKSKATMRFYPEFTDNKITKMPVDVHYEAWAPWNKQYSSDSLVVDLVKYYEEIFQSEFSEIYVPHLEKNAYMNVEGNRAITISRLSDMIARVEFIDLNAINIKEDYTSAGKKIK